MDARSTAVTVLVEVFGEGRSLSAALPDALAGIADRRDRALAQDLCYGVLRWWPRLEAIGAELLRKPLGKRDVDLQCLLMVGLYQLIHTRIPPHAAVAATVRVADQLGKPWARGLVNAVLRRWLREAEQIAARVDADDAVAVAHPRWLLERIRGDWPDRWREIADANNHRPPMFVRVNTRHGTRAGYLDELAEAGIIARPAAHGEAALVLEQPVDVARLPGFAEGRVSVQDAASQLAAELLDPQPGARVLDLCAAPGGKTGQILERQPRLAALTAVDHDAARLERVRENLDRLGVEAGLFCADGADPASWWDGVAFDRILLDAPCSATGVIRRHPDIKRLRRVADLDALIELQQRLLEAAWTMLADDGVLLYATCSIIHNENDERIRDFLAGHRDARELSIEAAWGTPLRHGRQILPGDDDMDGFYYARLTRPGGRGGMT